MNVNKLSQVLLSIYVVKIRISLSLFIIIKYSQCRESCKAIIEM